jgi:hypothetical protein
MHVKSATLLINGYISLVFVSWDRGIGIGTGDEDNYY